MIKLYTKKLLLCLIISIFTPSCGNGSNPAHSHSDGHTDADGFLIESLDGTELYREFQGIITGSINLNTNDTLEVIVFFLDDDQNKIEHEDEDHEVSESLIQVSEFNSEVASIVVESHTEEDSGHHVPGLHILGISVGETSFKLELMHGDHADYSSMSNVPVIVTSLPVIL
ncbi:MAG: hypothetical protein VX770_06820 [Candidatus Neomarinimicrobiota bacterium]|nr:hypothetical protein [Candidatus Neomarinimicrobiota bacterium]